MAREACLCLTRAGRGSRAVWYVWLMSLFEAWGSRVAPCTGFHTTDDRRIAASRGLPELTLNVIRSFHGHSTPSLKISCKSVQPFCQNTKRYRQKTDDRRQTDRRHTVPKARPKKVGDAWKSISELLVTCHMDHTVLPATGHKWKRNSTLLWCIRLLHYSVRMAVKR